MLGDKVVSRTERASRANLNTRAAGQTVSVSIIQCGTQLLGVAEIRATAVFARTLPGVLEMRDILGEDSFLYVDGKGRLQDRCANTVLSNTDFGKYIVHAFFRFHIVSHCFKINGSSHLINSFTLVDRIDLVLIKCLLCHRSCDEVIVLPRIQPYLSRI